jgi:hypothetical protein
MIGFALIVISFVGGLGLWMLGIRPHLARRGATLVTGANWGLSAWADWQTCSELARKKRDQKARTLSNAFVLAQVGLVLGIILLICGV